MAPSALVHSTLPVAFLVSVFHVVGTVTSRPDVPIGVTLPSVKDVLALAALSLAVLSLVVEAEGLVVEGELSVVAVSVFEPHPIEPTGKRQSSPT